MKLMTWKDAIATLLTGAIIAVYAAFLSGTSLWLISSGRGATTAVPRTPDIGRSFMQGLGGI